MLGRIRALRRRSAAVLGCELVIARAPATGSRGETPPELTGEDACGTGGQCPETRRARRIRKINLFLPVILGKVPALMQQANLGLVGGGTVGGGVFQAIQRNGALVALRLAVARIVVRE